MKSIYSVVLLVVSLFFACEQKSRNIDSNAAQQDNSENSPIDKQVKKLYDFERIYFDNRFDGARANNVRRKNDSIFLVTILPESEPVNQSPWYAFKVYSDEPMDIYVELDYKNFRHRYVPKLSKDGKNWTPYALDIDHNVDSTQVRLLIPLEKDTLWIASQEVISSDDMISWMNLTMASHEFLESEVAGKTVLNRNIYVISSKKEELKQSIVLIARQHPPEVPGGTVAFKAFFEELIADSELAVKFRNKYNLYVFPLLNPDGADLGHWRHNANGADLNRDWIDFLQPETRAVREYIRKKIQNENKTMSFGMDFHTSHSGPYLLIFDSLNEEKSRSKIIPRWTEKVRDPLLSMEYRRRSQELPYCYNWFYQEFDAEAVTYEDGDEIDRQVIARRAKLYATKLMETMIESH